MGKFRVEVTEIAKNQIAQHLKSGNQSSIKRIENILKELTVTPFEGIGNPEPLKYRLTGFWSRKINLKDRLIYSVDNGIVTVFIVSAMGHYSDK